MRFILIFKVVNRIKMCWVPHRGERLPTDQTISSSWQLKSGIGPAAYDWVSIHLGQAGSVEMRLT
jgi:hypothetical protein